MNTIDNRPRVAFGMKFTPRAQNIIDDRAGELLGEAWRNIYDVRKLTPYLENIKALAGHKRTHDLTLDINANGDGLFRFIPSLYHL